MIVAWIKVTLMEMKTNDRLGYILKIRLTVLDDGFDMGGERK